SARATETTKSADDESAFAERFLSIGAEELADGELQRAATKTFDKRVSSRVKVAVGSALVLVFFVSFMLGRYPVTPLELVQTIWQHFTDPSLILDPKLETVIFNLRLPRICLVMLSGAALAVAGASYQGMFKNPLVSPDILGASAGASMGACLALLLDMPSGMVQLFAFCGGMTAVGMAVWFNRTARADPILGLVLGGILVSTLFGSGTALIKFAADADDKLPAITFWLMGSFASVNQRDLLLALLPILLGFALLLLESWKLNVLSFGDEEARSMGVNTRVTRLIVVFASTLITSTVVAVAGIVGWIGLVIPHFARAIVGPNYRVLLPTSMVLGASYLLVVDDIARLIASVEIPVGILTSILGVPLFVVIFRHNMRGWR
ncbi:MAG: iron ABC transporter permease, partial [Coriobacteriia bacterium]|nr:iron ABC transporter permease [Coriobacteriia bacterium]